MHGKKRSRREEVGLDKQKKEKGKVIESKGKNE